MTLGKREKKVLDFVGNTIQIVFVLFGFAALFISFMLLAGCGDLPLDPPKLSDPNPLRADDISLGQIKFEANR